MLLSNATTGLEEAWSRVLNATHALSGATTPTQAVQTLTGDVLTLAVSLSLLLSLLCWVLSLLTNNYSHVDRLWSLAPPLYAVLFSSGQLIQLRAAVAAGQSLDEVQWRPVLVTGLILLWGLRLTYNFYRKGGYSLSGEDYRWAVLRQRMSGLQFQLLNVTFISFIQNLLLLALALPVYLASRVVPAAPLTPLDWVCVALFLLFLAGETLADQQQWAFQARKRQAGEKKGKSDPEAAQGFISSGLFRFSRHPNFFCEVSLWWCVYGFSVAALGWGGVVNWSGVGALFLSLLFHASTNFTEEISASKYPLYSRYQKATSRLLPWFPASHKKAL